MSRAAAHPGDTYTESEEITMIVDGDDLFVTDMYSYASDLYRILRDV